MRLIDADQFKAKLLSCMDRKATTPSDTDCILDGVLNLLEEQSTIDPVKHGHWIEGFPTETTDYFNCSVCYAGIFVNNLWRVSHKDVSEIHRYCHNCGAKMDGDDK